MPSNTPKINNDTGNSKPNVQPQRFNSQGHGTKDHKTSGELINLGTNEHKKHEKAKEDPFNVNNVDIGSIIFHEDEKHHKVSNDSSNLLDGKSNNNDVFDAFGSPGGSVSSSSPQKEQPKKSEFDLGSLGLNFGNFENNSKSTEDRTPRSNPNPNVKLPTVQQYFDLPPARGDLKNMDSYDIKEACDPIINVYQY